MSVRGSIYGAAPTFGAPGGVRLPNALTSAKACVPPPNRDTTNAQSNAADRRPQRRRKDVSVWTLGFSRRRPTRRGKGGEDGGRRGLSLGRHGLDVSKRGRRRRSVCSAGTMSSSPRNSAIRITASTKRCALLRIASGSFSRDRLDLYLIHWPRPRANRYVESWKAFVRLQREGSHPLDRRLKLQSRSP